jgi:hypothetical protein
MIPTYMVDDRTLSAGMAIRKKILENGEGAPTVQVINTKRFMLANRSNALESFINDEFGIRPLVTSKDDTATGKTEATEQPQAAK